MPEDTIQGIYLRYGIKMYILKRFNPDLGDTNLHTVKTLLIPAEHLRLRGKVFVPQERTKDVELQLFKHDTGLGSIEAKLYMDDNDWDVTRAKLAWAEDNAWEADQMRLRKEKEKAAKSTKFDQPKHAVATPIAIAEASYHVSAALGQSAPVVVATLVSAVTSGTATRPV
jgi:hypothetical protein